MFKRNAGACFAAMAFHLQPAVAAVEALRSAQQRRDYTIGWDIAFPQDIADI